MKKTIKILSFSFLVITIIFASVFAYFIISTRNYSFNKKKVSLSSQNFTYFDNFGNEIINYTSRDNIASSIPNHVKNAFISVEDKRFYSHKGIDFKRIIGATLKNIKSMSFKEGASTISQQLIKNTHLSSEKTLKRKFAEIKLALDLEKNYSKDEIIKMYLNTIYFGENCYGISNASLRYFNKKVENLTINESAMLAGIVKAPSVYNPVQNYDLSIKRKNLVLKLMKDNGFIGFDEFNRCLNEQITINYNKNYNNFIISECKKELDEIFKTPYVSKKLKIYTYIDLELQKNLENINLDVNCDKSYVVLDNYTGGVKAYYSTCGNIKRNPASTIKPLLVYAPCYNEKLINLQTKILDEPINYSGYSPKNYNDKYYGYVSAKEALAKSLNVPAVKLLNTLGIEKAKKYAKKLNINITNETLGIALGGIDNGVDLLTLASSYTTFSNNGEFREYKFIKKITDTNGKVLYEDKNQTKKVFSRESVDLINETLKYATKSGTSKKLSDKNYEVCAKTGTNGNEKGNLDAYNIAYTTNHTVAVWMGNRDNSYLNSKIMGSTYPTQVVSKILDNLYIDYTPKDFTLSDNIIKVKLDKNSYDKDGKIELGNDFLDSFEGLFIKGTEPKKNANPENKYSIKILEINCNNCTFAINYELCGYDGLALFEKNKKLTESNTNQIILTLSEGVHNFTLKGFYLKNGKKYYSKEIKLPQIIASKNYEIPKDWWRE